MNFLCSYLYIVATCNGRLFAAACSNLARSPLSLPLSFSRFCGLYTTLFRICIIHTLHLTKPILQVMSLKMRSPAFNPNIHLSSARAERAERRSRAGHAASTPAPQLGRAVNDDNPSPSSHGTGSPTYSDALRQGLDLKRSRRTADRPADSKQRVDPNNHGSRAHEA